MVVAVLGMKRLDSIWGPILPTKTSNGPSALTNRRGVLVNASNLLRIIAGLSLSVGDIQLIGHLFILNFNMLEFIWQICNCSSYHKWTNQQTHINKIYVIFCWFIVLYFTKYILLVFICWFVILYKYYLMYEYRTYKFETTFCTKWGRLCATNQVLRAEFSDIRN
jgi:hypothetical protein